MNQCEYYERIISDYILSCDEEVMWTRYNDSNRDWEGPIRACVTCSDTFAFACADAEVIEPEDIDELIALSKRGEKNGTYYGDLMWVCKKRNKRPLKAFLEDRYCSQTWRNWLDEVVPLNKETAGLGEIEKDTAQ